MRFLIIVLCFLILTGCDVYRSGQMGQPLEYNGISSHEKIAFMPPKQTSWKIETAMLSNGAVTRTYIPQFEFRTSWKQAFNETFFPAKLYSGKPQLLQRDIQRATRRICPDVNFKMLSSKKTTTNYTSVCEENDRFETGKIMVGSDGLYLLQYMAISNQVPERSIQFGMNTVMAARLSR